MVRRSARSTPERVLSPGELAVTRHLVVHGPATRGVLGDRLNLSYASMSRAARALIEGGMASEVLDSDPAVGRPRQILAAIPGARHVVGCKLTADTAYGVVCDMFGNVISTSQAALPGPDQNGVVPLAATAKLVSQLAAKLARRVPSLNGIGVALGGIVTDRSIVREGTFLGWRDVDLAGPIRERSGLPVTVTNDVTALAREQLWFGAGRSHSTFGVITVGAGLGFGVVREGVVVEELIDNGHLLAHAPIDSRGPRCEIGHAGCAMAFLNRADTASPDDSWLDGAARALGHLVATFAGALQTTCVVLAGEDVGVVADRPAMNEVIADRLRPGPDEAQRCTLDIITTPLTFTDWARGAAVAGIQNVLGAV
jgi:predicted NBD/HSP70 family sugar kinase